MREDLQTNTDNTNNSIAPDEEHISETTRLMAEDSSTPSPAAAVVASAQNQPAAKNASIAQDSDEKQTTLTPDDGEAQSSSSVSSTDNSSKPTEVTSSDDKNCNDEVVCIKLDELKATSCSGKPAEDADIDTDSVTSIIMETKVEEDAVSRVSSVQGDMCRICHCIAEDSETLISPCDCCGSMKWVHQKCLQRWVKSRDAKKCELCGFPFNMTSSVKPFRKWKKLNMSSVERRRVLCSVTFHVVAITCVIWSLYVLIDRTTQEIQDGNLNWPFWTKLVVVAIGFTGGLVFMYVQCKTYVKLFRRWKQFNRVIFINNVQLPDMTESEATAMAETTSDSETVVPGESIVIIQMPERDPQQSG